MSEVMRAKLWTSHAEEANNEHQVLYSANLRHGRSTIGFHPRDLEVSIEKSRFRHHCLLSPTSSLLFGSSLSGSLFLNGLDGFLIEVGIVALWVCATVLRQ
eukprot:12552259-Heterocapsa_arctica.AAC.1